MLYFNPIGVNSMIACVYGPFIVSSFQVKREVFGEKV